MKVLIVIPTYNEAENVKKLVPLISEHIKGVEHDVMALFVDDSSPDGTADILDGLKREYPFIDVLVRKEKDGLGAAYIAGFNKAMNDLNADIIMEMDADLQHDPKEIPNFIKAVEEGADYVIGSRYVKGGSIPEEWAFYRKVLSWGGSLFARITLGALDVKDFTTGYRASRVKGGLDQIDLGDIMSAGFAYKIDLLYRFIKIGAKIKEIPIQFALRDGGKSKMEQNNMLESLRVVILLKLRDSINFIKFGIVGFAGFVTDTALFNFLRISLLSSEYASAFSGFLAMILTFLLNNAWSFSERKIETPGARLKVFVPYAISSYIPIIFRSWLVAYSLERFGDTTLIANAAFFVGMLIGLVWNFTVYSKIIWRKKVI